MKGSEKDKQTNREVRERERECLKPYKRRKKRERMQENVLLLNEKEDELQFLDFFRMSLRNKFFFLIQILVGKKLLKVNEIDLLGKKAFFKS